jgi:hypothetical protein
MGHGSSIGQGIVSRYEVGAAHIVTPVAVDKEWLLCATQEIISSNMLMPQIWVSVNNRCVRQASTDQANSITWAAHAIFQHSIEQPSRSWACYGC